MSDRPYRVVFEKGDERWEADAADGETLLVVAQRVQAPVHTLCTGVGTCVQCKVEVREGATTCLRCPRWKRTGWGTSTT